MAKDPTGGATFKIVEATTNNSGRPVVSGTVLDGRIYHGDVLTVAMDDGSTSECRVWHFVGVLFAGGLEWEYASAGDNIGLLVDQLDCAKVIPDQAVKVVPGNRPEWSWRLGVEGRVPPSWA